MTREELKEHCLKQVACCEEMAKLRGDEPHGRIYEEHKLILELLEEEPFINKPCISRGVCEHDKNAVLDKIRTEIEHRRQRYKTTMHYIEAAREQELSWVLDVIDGYKSEK
jgi:hypothetical protein